MIRGSQQQSISKESRKKHKTAHRIESTRRHVQHLNDNESVITTHTTSAENTQEVSDRLRVENKQEIVSTLNDVQRRTLAQEAINVIGKVTILKNMLKTVIKFAIPEAAQWTVEDMLACRRNTNYHYTYVRWSELLKYTANMDEAEKTTILSHIFVYKVLLFSSRNLETEMPRLFGDVEMTSCELFGTVCKFEVRFPYSDNCNSEQCFIVSNIPVKVFQLFDVNMFGTLMTNVKQEMMIHLPVNCTIKVE